MKRGTPRHPKVTELAQRLSIPKFSAIGLLEMLWHFAAEFAHDGNIGRFKNSEIASALSWEQDPEHLISSMILTAWIDPCQCHRLRVHDWPDHADQTVCRVMQKRGMTFLPCYDRKDEGFIYCIRQGVNGPLKIGWALDPRNRIDALQTGNPEPLKLIAVLNGSRTDEASIHARFNHLRLFGEWFKPENEILTLFISNTSIQTSQLASTPEMLALEKTSQPYPFPSPSPSPKANTNTNTTPDGVDGVVPPVKSKRIPAQIEFLPEHLATPENVDAWGLWIQYRKELKKPVTPSTAKAWFKLIEQHGSVWWVDSVNQSIANGWQGLFDPKPNGSKNGKTHEQNYWDPSFNSPLTDEDRYNMDVKKMKDGGYDVSKMPTYAEEMAKRGVKRVSA